MLGSTHIAMTKAVLDALDWPGDRNLAARNADYPDRVRAIEIEKYGAYIIGHNLASLTHFCRPTGNGTYAGYCWKSDRSVPAIDLSTVKVIPKPEAWGWPFDSKTEPLAKLVKDLTGHATIQADEMTYSTCAIMGAWMFDTYHEIAHLPLVAIDRQKALDILAGSLFHVCSQDPSVLYHGMCMMLDGHSSFEGDVDEMYKKLFADGTIPELLKTLVKANNVPDSMTVRSLAESTASKSIVSTKRLCWCRTVWRKGWNKLVKACVLRGLTTSVQLGKILIKEASSV